MCLHTAHSNELAPAVAACRRRCGDHNYTQARNFKVI